jgi:hypothetical protein
MVYADIWSITLVTPAGASVHGLHRALDQAAAERRADLQLVDNAAPRTATKDLIKPSATGLKVGTAYPCHTRAGTIGLGEGRE